MSHIIGVFLDPVYQGIYHSKLAHPPDLDAVLQRSYDIGVKKVDMSTLLDWTLIK